MCLWENLAQVDALRCCDAVEVLEVALDVVEGKGFLAEQRRGSIGGGSGARCRVVVYCHSLCKHVVVQWSVSGTLWRSVFREKTTNRGPV